jgi:DNA-binding response OmpR family regulator
MTEVLVAEDDTDIRELIAFQLERAGHAVVTAPDGPSALAVARARRPDAAVLDITMPGMSGLEVCQALRDDPTNDHMVIMVLTARLDVPDLADGRFAGADDYLAKPFSPRELVARIESLLARGCR